MGLGYYTSNKWLHNMSFYLLLPSVFFLNLTHNIVHCSIYQICLKVRTVCTIHCIYESRCKFCCVPGSRNKTVWISNYSQNKSWIWRKFSLFSFIIYEFNCIANDMVLFFLITQLFISICVYTYTLWFIFIRVRKWNTSAVYIWNIVVPLLSF